MEERVDLSSEECWDGYRAWWEANPPPPRLPLRALWSDWVEQPYYYWRLRLEDWVDSWWPKGGWGGGEEPPPPDSP